MAAPDETMKPYWVTMAWAGGAGILISAGAVWLFETLGPGGPGSLPAAFTAPMWGAIVGVITWTFVLVGTLPLARSLPRHRVLFAVLSALAPLVGWTVLGLAIDGFRPSWIFPLYPTFGAIWGVIAGVVSATITAIVLPRRTPTPPHLSRMGRSSAHLSQASELFGGPARRGGARAARGRVRRRGSG